MGSIRSERRRTGFTGTDSNSLRNIEDEYLAVSDLFGGGGITYRLYDGLFELLGNHDFHFDFRQKANGVLGSTIDLGMATLPSETLHFAHGKALDPDPRQ